MKRLVYRRDRLTRLLVRLYLTAVGALARDRPVSPRLLRAVRRVATGVDPLAPTPFPALGRELRNPILRGQLAQRELGVWSLGPSTIDFLEDEVRRHRPMCILEFGSGVSTVCLAQFMADLHGESGLTRVISIEQDQHYAEETSALLRATSLDGFAVVLHAPLTRQVIEGVETTCYRMPSGFAAAPRIPSVDLVVIDGPSAEPGARFGTLPLARQVISTRARFVLDDALRDGELAVADRWERLPFIAIEGIRLVEKGILTGWLRGPS